MSPAIVSMPAAAPAIHRLGSAVRPILLITPAAAAKCSPAFIAKASQVANPVVDFAKDNNGVIVELPSASGTAATLSGSLIFGIGTESNNQLSSSATVFTLACDDFHDGVRWPDFRHYQHGHLRWSLQFYRQWLQRPLFPQCHRELPSARRTLRSGELGALLPHLDREPFGHNGRREWRIEVDQLQRGGRRGSA